MDPQVKVSALPANPGIVSTDKIIVNTLTQTTVAAIDDVTAYVGLNRVKQVGTIAELQLLTGEYVGQPVQVAGYTAAGDGGGGLFLWAESGPYVTNGGTIITPTGGDGTSAWLRPPGSLPFAAFGAVGDLVQDDTSAIQAAFSSGRKIIDTGGEYRITGTLTLPHPFHIEGAGTEKTILQFESRGGFAGSDGINVTVTGNIETSYMGSLTIAIKGAHGRYGISTPRGTAVFTTNKPKYIFERVVFRGDVESDLFGLYDYGWARTVDLGDSRESVIRDCMFMGTYDYRVNPATAAINNVAIYMSGIMGEGGVLMTHIDHTYIHYHGKAVEIGWQVSNPKITAGQFHRCYDGIYSPNAASGNNYGMLEIQISDMNINAQRYGIYSESTAFVSIQGTRSTRASGGFDHANTWYGYYFKDTTDLKMDGCRAYNTSATYTNQHIGIYLDGGDFSVISGMYILGETGNYLTKGLVIKEHARIIFTGQITKAAIGISFEASVPYDIDADIIAQFTSLVTTQFSYDANVDKTGILIHEGRSKHTSADATINTITAAGTTSLVRGVDNQVKRFQFNAGAGIYTHNIDFSNVGAAGGDYFIVLILLSTSANPTVVVRDGAGATLLSLNNVSGAEKEYRVEVVYGGTAWRIIGANENI